MIIKPLITSISWRPARGEEIAYHTFKAATSDGRVLSWKPENGQELETLFTSEINYYHTIDHSNDGGKKFVCAGKLPMLEIYDDETLKRVSFFDTGDRIGHVNKIFCAKFDLDNPNVIYSGGWDRNVCIWDIRAGGNHCGTIFGP